MIHEISNIQVNQEECRLKVIKVSISDNSTNFIIFEKVLMFQDVNTE